MLLPSNPLYTPPICHIPPTHSTSCYSNLVAKQHPTSMYVHLGPHPTHYMRGSCITVFQDVLSFGTDKEITGYWQMHAEVFESRRLSQ